MTRPPKKIKREGLSLSLRLILSLLCAVGLVARNLGSLLLGVSLGLLCLLLAVEGIGLSLTIAVVGVAVAGAGGHLDGDYHEVVLAIRIDAGDGNLVGLDTENLLLCTGKQCGDKVEILCAECIVSLLQSSLPLSFLMFF